MKMNLIEMEGFLRGKCLPGDIKTGESNAEYLVRKFSELHEQLSESQREFRLLISQCRIWRLSAKSWPRRMRG